jgi:hypothetical protein
MICTLSTSSKLSTVGRVDRCSQGDPRNRWLQFDRFYNACEGAVDAIGSFWDLEADRRERLEEVQPVRLACNDRAPVVNTFSGMNHVPLLLRIQVWFANYASQEEDFECAVLVYEFSRLLPPLRGFVF